MSKSSLLALFAVLSGLVWAQPNVASSNWPPPQWSLIDDVWLPDEAIYGDAVYIPLVWPGGQVPYVFDSALQPWQERALTDAMAEIEAVSAVRFVPWLGGGFDFLLLTRNPSSANVSNSALGRVGGPQEVRIGANHWDDRFIIVHELFHALGFLHEHQRIDRDQFVTIQTQNISPVACDGPCNHNFSVNVLAPTVGQYDFASIMHYGTHSFSSNGQPTILPKPAYASQVALMGNREALSQRDAAGLAAVYGQASSPSIQSISRSSAVAGSDWALVIITGTGFSRGSETSFGVQGSQVRLGLNPLTTIFVSKTEIRGFIPPELLQTPRLTNINVLNDPAAGGQSNSIPFEVTWPPCGSQNDQVGYSIAALGDVDADGLSEIAIGSPGAGSGGEVRVQDESGQINWSIAISGGARLGQALAVAGDYDQDGVSDLLIGAPGANSNTGLVQVRSGRTGALLQSFSPSGLNSGAEFGWAVCNAGDIDLDGVPDALIGIPNQGSGGGFRVLSGAAGSVIFAAQSTDSGARFGASVAGNGDFTGDGRPDFVVGAFNADDRSRQDVGRVFCYDGVSGQLISTKIGDGAFDQFGRSVALIGHSHDSTRSDILVGAPDYGSVFNQDGGSGYVRRFDGSQSSLPTLVTWNGQALGDRFGWSVIGVGDVDEDGYEDIGVGATQAGTGPSGLTGSGYVRIYCGREQRLRWSEAGRSQEEQFGWSLASDAGGNLIGRRSLVVGAPFSDVPCPNAGFVRHLSLKIPPTMSKLMLTEIATGEPQGIEITNFSGVPYSLTGYRIRWQPKVGRGFPGFDIPLPSITLAPGEIIVFHEVGSTFSEMPLATRSFPWLPPTTSFDAPLSVALIQGNGAVLDEVRISESDDLGDSPNLGGLFRGYVRRTARGTVGLVAQRIDGLETQSGADWRTSERRTMGLLNDSIGLRGIDPTPIAAMLINEIDTSSLFVELRNQSSSRSGSIDLTGWTLRSSASQGAPHDVFELKAQAVLPGQRIVVGNSLTRPAESPSTTPYQSVSSRSGGGLGFSHEEFDLALIDDFGRPVDVLRFSRAIGEVAHNHPRVPSAFEDFTGVVRRSASPLPILARNESAMDRNLGEDLGASAIRTMGSANAPIQAVTPLFGPRFEVRLDETSTGDGLSIRIAVSPIPELARWSFLWSLGHQDGQGPLIGLGSDAYSNWLITSVLLPWNGLLDGDGSARVDLPSGSLPPGFAMDTLFLLQGPAGEVLAVTAILEFDT